MCLYEIATIFKSFMWRKKRTDLLNKKINVEVFRSIDCTSHKGLNYEIAATVSVEMTCYFAPESRVSRLLCTTSYGRAETRSATLAS